MPQEKVFQDLYQLAFAVVTVISVVGLGTFITMTVRIILFFRHMESLLVEINQHIEKVFTVIQSYSVRESGRRIEKLNEDFGKENHP